MPPEQQKHAIPVSTAIFMLAVAVLFDGLQAAINLLQGVNAVVPGLGVVLVYVLGAPLTIWAWLTFYVWFKVHGVSFLQTKRLIIWAAAGLADAIMNAFPAWVAAVALTFLTIRAEEALVGALEKAGGIAGGAAKVASVAARFAGGNKQMSQNFRGVAEQAREVARQARGAQEALRQQGGGGAEGRGE